MTTHDANGISLKSYVRVVLRWKWLVLATMLVVLGAGVAYTWMRTPLYTASSQLLYAQQIDIQNPLGGLYVDTAAQQAEIESMPAVIASSEVREAAEALMKPAPIPNDYIIEAVLTPGTSGYSNVVTLKAQSAKPRLAAAAANAYAEAFIAWGHKSAQKQISDAIAVVKAKLAPLTDPTASEYLTLQSTLQKLELLKAAITGNFKIITRATVPSQPSSPNKQRGAILALLGGAVLGVGLAFLVEQFDTRVRNEDEVAEMLGLGVVGHIPALTRRDRERGVMKTLVDPSGAAAEAYRMLRSNLEYAALGDDLHVLLVSSSVQGEGKSVIACNLAVSLAMAGRRVILVDADLRAPQVHHYLGIPNVSGVSTVVSRRHHVMDALLGVSLAATHVQDSALVMSSDMAPPGAVSTGRVPAVPAHLLREPIAAQGRSAIASSGSSLRVLPSGPLPPNPGEIVASRRFGEILGQLAEDCDLVIVDAPAMLPVGDTAAIAPWVDALVFVADPSVVRRPVLERARAQLSHLPCRKLGVIFFVESQWHSHYGYYTRDRDGNAPSGARHG